MCSLNRAGVGGEQWFNIGQLTDVSGCKLQKYFYCKQQRAAVRYGAWGLARGAAFQGDQCPLPESAHSGLLGNR